jgi:hypothetical protein
VGGNLRLPDIILSAFLPGMSEMCARCPINATTSCSTSLCLPGSRRIFSSVFMRWHGMVIICRRWGTIVLLRWVWELCILCNSRFCVCIPGRSRVGGRTVHDRAQRSEGIYGLSGCMVLPGWFRTRTVRRKGPDGPRSGRMVQGCTRTIRSCMARIGRSTRGLV